ncbi:MAG: PQQ-like beta-propeller repeat protein [Spirochaetales bacterium]|nr:PQQ-like beta-propeller repeat protein [Spirochaetales bacterium]
MNGTDTRETGKRMIVYAVLRGIAAAAALFSAVTGAIITITFFQLSSLDPVNLPQLASLYEAYNEHPEDEALKDRLRSLDLLARRAFFTAGWQIRTGGYLFAGGAGLAVLCLLIMSLIKKPAPRPGGEPSPGGVLRSRRLIRGLTAGLAGGFFLFSLAASFIASDRLENPAAGISGTNPEGAASSGGKESLADGWTCFRGGSGAGIAPEGTYPVDWDGESGKGIRWKKTLPLEGFNSPVVYDNRVFLSSASKESLLVLCFDAGDGGLLWEKEVKDVTGKPSVFPEVSADTGYAAPGLATDGERVFALFATGDLVCLSLDGEVLWSRPMGVPENAYGHASSLVTKGGRLFVQYDGENTAGLFCFDASSGEILWETPREVHASWSSPVIVSHGGRAEIILSANPIVASYDLVTGKALWSVECMVGEVGPSPAYADGKVFAANQFASLVAIDPDNEEILWEYYDELPDVASPCAAGGILFMATSYGIVCALEAETGGVFWTAEYEEGFYASPILADGRVYALDRKGVMRIIEASAEYNLIAQPALGDDTVSTPAFYRSGIFIRSKKYLFCIGGLDAED